LALLPSPPPAEQRIAFRRLSSSPLNIKHPSLLNTDHHLPPQLPPTPPSLSADAQ
jgi:hypothetical protein